MGQTSSYSLVLLMLYFVHRTQLVTSIVSAAGCCHLQVRFIVMNNLFQTDLHVQRKYDLKGSTQGRFSGKAPTPNTILKDLDLDISLKLEEGWHERYIALQASVQQQPRQQCICQVSSHDLNAESGTC